MATTPSMVQLRQPVHNQFGGRLAALCAIGCCLCYLVHKLMIWSSSFDVKKIGGILCCPLLAGLLSRSSLGSARAVFVVMACY
uniref:Uncharacterized protein n=1 Tax=Aegilops tauschii subsp. strangulata TaxID=200361 RepID=A0A453S7C2_AEGTS